MAERGKQKQDSTVLYSTQTQRVKFWWCERKGGRSHDYQFFFSSIGFHFFFNGYEDPRYYDNYLPIFVPGIALFAVK